MDLEVSIQNTRKKIHNILLWFFVWAFVLVGGSGRYYGVGSLEAIVACVFLLAFYQGGYLLGGFVLSTIGLAICTTAVTIWYAMRVDGFLSLAWTSMPTIAILGGMLGGTRGAIGCAIIASSVYWTIYSLEVTGYVFPLVGHESPRLVQFLSMLTTELLISLLYVHSPFVPRLIATGFRSISKC